MPRRLPVRCHVAHVINVSKPLFGMPHPQQAPCHIRIVFVRALCMIRPLLRAAKSDLM
jgi:hypothetical protein